MLSTAWMCVRVDSMALYRWAALSFYRSSLRLHVFGGSSLDAVIRRCSDAQLLSGRDADMGQIGSEIKLEIVDKCFGVFYTHFYFDSHISHSRRKWMRFLFEFGSCASRRRFLTETSRAKELQFHLITISIRWRRLRTLWLIACIFGIPSSSVISFFSQKFDPIEVMVEGGKIDNGTAVEPN